MFPSSPIEKIFGFFSGLGQFFYDAFLWLMSQWEALMDAIDPIKVVLNMTGALVGFMPEPIDLTYVREKFTGSMVYVHMFVQFMHDYVDMNTLSICLSIMLLVELSLIPLRVVRTIRSIVW